MEPQPEPAVVAEEVEELYGALSERLEQLVRRDVRAPEPLIEDACQFAWSRLIHHRHRVRRDTALAWLLKTAAREAVKLVRRDGRELSLDATLDELGEQAIPHSSASPDQLLEQKERIAQMQRLPERQQRLLWLHAMGLTYSEMARHEGATRRTVERQLLRAKRRVRAEAAELGA